MNQKSLFLTFLNYLTCFGVISWVLLGATKETMQALQPPPGFLGPIYYGEEITLKVFDHNLPLFKPQNDGNDFIIHYDGTPYFEEDNPSYGYDQHLGVDYNLQYELVLASANGIVTVAGWAEPDDHRRSYGLHVQMIPTNNPSYRLWYGHLSSLMVQTGEVVSVNPTEREGTIGISGNTGSVRSVLGSCPPVEEQPLCGSHLHFEVRIGGKPVNPYGWTGSYPDPWSVWVRPTATVPPGAPTSTPGTPVTGATSYDLWLNYPARVANPAQYPDGTAVAEPLAPVAVRTIDNEDPEFTVVPDEPEECMETEATGGFDGSFRYVLANGAYCEAAWQVTPNELTTAGEYDVYVHIPQPPAEEILSRGAEYTIVSNGGVETYTAVVVQAVYPNEYHPDRWVYIGRYYFTMQGVNEFVRVSSSTFDGEGGDGAGFLVAADAVQFASVTGPIVTATPAQSTATATLSPPPTPTTTSPPDIEVVVNQSSDDAGIMTVSTFCTYGTSHQEIYFGHCNNSTAIISGFRFTGVAIPAGAMITQARIVFTTDGPYENTLEMELRGELSPNSPTFDSIIRPDNRPLTEASVLWLISATDDWDSLDVRYSPDLRTVIQEIVNLNGWQSGNALSIITQPQSGATANGHRRVLAWDRLYDGSRYPAKLQIWYTAASSTPPPVTPSPTSISATPTPSLDFRNPTAHMADIGGDGNGFEVNPTNGYSNNSLFAIDRSSGTLNLTAPCTNPNSDRHRFYNYGFNIPGLTTIRGIEVRLDAKVENSAGLPQMCIELSWNGGTNWTTGKVTPVLTTVETSYLLGGPTDTWGRTWLPSNFSNANFRVRVIDIAGVTTQNFYLDWVAVKVYYP